MLCVVYLCCKLYSSVKYCRATFIVLFIVSYNSKIKLKLIPHGVQNNKIVYTCSS